MGGRDLGSNPWKEHNASSLSSWTQLYQTALWLEYLVRHCADNVLPLRTAVQLLVLAPPALGGLLRHLVVSRSGV